MKDLSEILEEEVACLVAESTLWYSGKSIRPGTHMIVILLLIECRVDSVRRILWMRWLGLKESLSKWSDDSESVRSTH